jgi:hypothetical protein
MSSSNAFEVVSAGPKATRRIYAVRRNDEIVGLIRAGNPSQAVRHVVRQDYSANVAEQEELVSTISGGMKVQDAGADDA